MASLDMSLDDMIKNRRGSDRRSRGGRGRPQQTRGPGGPPRGGRPFGASSRRGPLGVNTRPAASTIAKSFRRPKTLPWQSGLFEDGMKAAGMSGLDTGAKLYISNLDTGVTNEDIRELFSEVGELMRFAVHYERNGRPSGTAEVFFVRRTDALKALKKYNNVQLDGKPMRIEIIGASPVIPVSARINVVGGGNGRKRTVVMGSSGPPPRSRAAGFAAPKPGFVQRGRGGPNTGRGGGRGRGRVGGRGGGRGGAGQWRKKPVEKSATQLDKELESYHTEAMQT